MRNIEMVTTGLPYLTSNTVARFLFDSATKNGSLEQTSISKIAQLLEMTPYAVNESLLRLQDRGVIQLQRGRIVVRNMG